MKPYYENDGITLFHGDCMTVLPQLAENSVEVCVTSPPYNLSDRTLGMKTSFFAKNRKNIGKWDSSKIQNGYENYRDDMPFEKYCKWQQAVLAELWRVSSGAIFYNHKPRPVKGQIQLPLEWFNLPLRQIIIWARNGGLNASRSHYTPMHEWILFAAKEDFQLKSKAASMVGDVWNIAVEQNTTHPAPFPVALPLRVIETTLCKSVVDPFAGSGSTLAAARRWQRRKSLASRELELNFPKSIASPSRGDWSR